MDSTTTISRSSETNTLNDFFTNDISLQMSKVNEYYLLAGTGAFIFIILVIIVIQIGKRLKSANKKSLYQRKSNERQTCDENVNRPPNDHSKNYLNITSSNHFSHLYKRMDAVYHEIDDSLELMPVTPSNDRSINIEDYNLPTSKENSICKDLKIDDSNARDSELYVLASAENTCPDTNNGGYLHPALVRANIETEIKEDNHSYIDVTG